MADQPLIVFAGGGTGGHLFPALAVAEQIRRLGPQVDIEFHVTDRAIDRQILDPGGWRTVAQGVRPFSTRPWDWPRFWIEWRRSVRAATARMKGRPPRVVVGTGGYGAGPPIHAAHDLGISTALINPDLIPGRANRHLGKKVEAVFCQWEGSASHFPLVSHVIATGCPVRRSFLEVDRSAAWQEFGLDPNRKTLLITGASQGARTVNQAVVELLGGLASRRQHWQVLHLTGALDHARVVEAYRGRLDDAVVLPFTEKMAEAIAAADLVISRAGASTLAELTAVGRPSILFPYPYHKDMHQRANARVLADAGAAVLLDDAIDAKANAGRLGPILEDLMGYPEKLARMAEAAKAIGRPDAAQTVARYLLEMTQLI